MPGSNTAAHPEEDLADALDALSAALAAASEAAARIATLAPRLARAGSVLQEIEALVRTRDAAVAPATPQSRPILIAPARPRQRPAAAPEPPASTAVVEDERGASSAPDLAPIAPAPATAPAPLPEALALPVDEPLTCFRLEFESAGPPLDLRVVDDAVGAHPAVRDVALLDYDGRRVTLKVWIAGDETPAGVQSALKADAPRIFGKAHDVNIVALEDVA